MADERTQSTGTRRQQQKAETRALILNSARDLFEELGFERATMRAVAAAAGVGLGTIFSHFPDKSALLVAALLDDLAEEDRKILATFPADAPVREQIMHFARAGFGYWCRRPALSATLLREMYFIRGPWAENRREETARFIEVIAGVLEGARQRGELRSDADITLAAEALYATYVGLLIGACGENRFELDELKAVFEAFIDTLLQGIGAHTT